MRRERAKRLTQTTLPCEIRRLAEIGAIANVARRVRPRPHHRLASLRVSQHLACHVCQSLSAVSAPFAAGWTMHRRRLAHLPPAAPPPAIFPILVPSVLTGTL